MTWQAWRPAWERAHLGPDGFYRRTGPSRHFRTSASHADVLAPALVRLLVEVDADLGSPPELDLVDVGAGDGGLLAAIVAAAHRDDPGLAGRLRPLALDVRPRPPDLPDQVEWGIGTAPSSLTHARPDGIAGLLLAHEFLDDVPCDVVERVGGTWHLVLVEPASGRERTGPPLDEATACHALGVDPDPLLRWLADWWPDPRPGDRAEVGTSRDDAWAALVATVRHGTALAVDYGHRRVDRATAAGRRGTLAAYRHGRRVDPVPDGSCNVTAHVAMDSCATAGAAAAATTTAHPAAHGRHTGTRTMLRTQRDALVDLGVDGRPPSADPDDPAGYLATLARAGSAATLLDPAGLGSFWWLRHDLTG